MKVAVVIIGKWDHPIKEELVYNTNVKILSNSKHNIVFIPCCWEEDIEQFDSFNPLAIPSPQPLSYHPYEKIRRKDLEDYTTYNWQKGIGFTSKPKSNYEGRVFQLLQFYAVYKQIKNDYDIIFKIRWDAIIRNDFIVDKYIDELLENENKIFGFATPRKYQMYDTINFHTNPNDNKTWNLTSSTMRSKERTSFYNTPSERFTADYSKFLYDIGIMFTTKKLYVNIDELYAKEELLPAEWGWYQIFESKELIKVNVTNQLTHLRPILNILQ